VRKFDLNIEEVLEDWEIYHAVREIIANALDEQALTKTKDIQISKINDRFSIRDFGRGLQYVHLTQNENDEKLENPDIVIGKFGVGLKDALATLHRRKVEVLIKTKNGDITLERTSKHDFEDIDTLHAIISESSDSSFIGTEFLLKGCTDEDIDKAKNLFLKFSNEILLEETKFGQVLGKKSETSNIYINGVKVSKEENFLFSYNITSMTQAMRKAMNRERTNVGRSAYTERVKSILMSCKSSKVAKSLVDDLNQFKEGTQHDELSYVDVSVHACKILNSQNNVIFVSSQELQDQVWMVDEAKRDGHEIIVIPENIKEKIHNIKDLDGNTIRDLDQYTIERHESFEYQFVESKDLSKSEKDIFENTDKILLMIGGRPKNVRDIKISETMRIEMDVSDSVGVWDDPYIIIKRSQLNNLKSYAGTLLHEAAHATSGFSDVSRGFESELTKFLGLTSKKSFT